MHVLFLEYNNQRAWLTNGALQRYAGKRRFEEEAAKAGPNRKKDFVPGKRYQAQFDRAVEFSESLLKLPSEDRLEAVFHKYGWVMVSEPGDEPDIGGHKSKKRKVVVDCDLEANKSTDSEADSQLGSGSESLTMHRRTSADRRSSAEAETRLDPGVDSLDGDIDASSGPRTVSTPSGANKKKRESSLVAAIAMNGDSSSDENISDSDRSGSKKKRKLGSENATPKHPPSKTESQSSPVPPPVIPSETKSAARPAEDEFPRVGDLVWGRMSGFPFWPSFVTKSPAGQYKKVGSNGKANYHVQFFNWNDESGWVNAVLEFDGIDSFKKIAGKFSFIM